MSEVAAEQVLDTRMQRRTALPLRGTCLSEQDLPELVPGLSPPFCGCAGQAGARGGSSMCGWVQARK